MERVRSWETITAVGQTITQRWRELAQQHGLTIQTSGLAALTTFAFSGPHALAYKTLITQEMLKQGILATTAVYTCIAHTPAVLERYFAALSPIFGLIRQCEEGRDVLALLEGPVCQSGFKRLN